MYNVILKITYILSLKLSEMKRLLKYGHYMLDVIVYTVTIVANGNVCMKEFGPVCPKSSDPFFVVTYYIKWVTTSWTYST